MFDYKYLSPKHLKGLNNYKYSAIDTSPLSKYVMTPACSTIVKWIPNSVAPNLLTFSGFLCMLTNILLLTYYDYDCYASGAPKDYQGYKASIPLWVFTACGVLLFAAYVLDALDGKQARKIGVSGPLGELFDHGLDSYIVFMIPYSLFSVFGRDEYSVSTFRAYLMVSSVVLNFYVSHWEKYSTGTLYLPWGYDVSMWAASILFIATGAYGPELYKMEIFSGTSFVQALEIAVHCTGLFTTLPIAIYNVYLSHKNGTIEKFSLAEILRPIWSMAVMICIMTLWVWKSPNEILTFEPRAFMLLFGTLFSHIACRLIISEITKQRCDSFTWILTPTCAGVVISLVQPALEHTILYTMLLISILAHLHYGVCVVRQICKHYNIMCFTVPKPRIQSQRKGVRK